MPEHLAQDTFKAGVIVQGTATVPHPPVNNTDAASKQYVDSTAEVYVGTAAPTGNEEFWVDLNATAPSGGAPAPKITVSATAPANPAVGDLWLDTTT